MTTAIPFRNTIRYPFATPAGAPDLTQKERFTLYNGNITSRTMLGQQGMNFQPIEDGPQIMNMVRATLTDEDITTHLSASTQSLLSNAINQNDWGSVAQQLMGLRTSDPGAFSGAQDYVNGELSQIPDAALMQMQKARQMKRLLAVLQTKKIQELKSPQLIRLKKQQTDWENYLKKMGVNVNANPEVEQGVDREQANQIANAANRVYDQMPI